MTTMLSNLFQFFKTLAMHLWWSVSSVQFYERVIKKYYGYGIKYVFILSFFGTLLAFILITSYSSTLKSYAETGIVTDTTKEVDFVLKQFPDINYDGKNISLEGETPLFLKDSNNNRVVALDPENKIMPSERDKIFILLKKDRVIINSGALSSKISDSAVPLVWEKMLGDQPRVISQDQIREAISKTLDALSFTTYIAFPFVFIITFFNILFGKIFLILAVFIITQFSSMHLGFKGCMRVVLFASGVFTLFEPSIIFLPNSSAILLWGVQIWANLLMIMAIVRTNKSFIA